VSDYVIIGASSAIGLALAKQLANEGHAATGTYNNRGPAAIEGVQYLKLNVLEDQPYFSFLPNPVEVLAYCSGSIQLKPFSRIKAADY
jgi:NAD(P)-dependent dehydrogenase (short-subunit alcohol dehydrogenase family)